MGKKRRYKKDSFKKKLEERVGFEPTVPLSRNNGFQDRRIRPLCHLSRIDFN
jgi:hypothetical protein